MADTNDTRYDTGNAVCDALRFICDASYAILPRDVARQLGEFEKNLWGGLRWFADKKIDWIDASLDAADRLRDEWRRRGAATADASHATASAHDGPEHV